MAAAVPLALADLEAAVPLADLESALVVFDAAADVFVGDVLDEVVGASFFEPSCLRKIKPSISLYDGGHGHAEVMERRRKNVKRIWLSRSRWIMVDGEQNE